MRLDSVTTDRLTLRPLAVSDAPDVAAYYAKNADRLKRVGPFGPTSIVAETWVERAEQVAVDLATGKGVRVVLRANDDGRLAGLVSITDAIRGPLLAANLGFSLDRDDEGKGLLIEALFPLIDWAFTGFALHRLDAGYQPWNARSGNVLARLGFRTEGYSPRFLFFEGAWQDSVRTALDVDDWARVTRRGSRVYALPPSKT